LTLDTDPRLRQATKLEDAEAGGSCSTAVRVVIVQLIAIRATLRLPVEQAYDNGVDIPVHAPRMQTDRPRPMILEATCTAKLVRPGDGIRRDEDPLVRHGTFPGRALGKKGLWL
jgi:hypothetical protein